LLKLLVVAVVAARATSIDPVALAVVRIAAYQAGL
jgi:hypothetical protein